MRGWEATSRHCRGEPSPSTWTRRCGARAPNPRPSPCSGQGSDLSACNGVTQARAQHAVSPPQLSVRRVRWPQGQLFPSSRHFHKLNYRSARPFDLACWASPGRTFGRPCCFVCASLVRDSATSCWGAYRARHPRIGGPAVAGIAGRSWAELLDGLSSARRPVIGGVTLAMRGLTSGGGTKAKES